MRKQAAPACLLVLSLMTSPLAAMPHPSDSPQLPRLTWMEKIAELADRIGSLVGLIPAGRDVIRKTEPDPPPPEETPLDPEPQMVASGDVDG